MRVRARGTEPPPPEVSVIIPTYNRPHFLREAVQSVLNQSFQDFEIIIVDDGSTDDTPEVARSFSDSRIRYLRRDNGKLARARNTGLAAARGRFVALLDDDDTYLPCKLETQVAHLSANAGIGLVAGGWQLVDDENRVIKECPPNPKQPLDLEAWLTSCPLIVNSVLFRREFATVVGGFDPNALPLEDWDFWLRLAHAGCVMAWHQGIICRYRQHGQNTPRAAVLDLYKSGFSPTRKYFSEVSSQDIPAPILARKNWFLARSHLTAAFYSIDAGDIEEAQGNVRDALRYYPQWADADLDSFAQLVADYLRLGADLSGLDETIELVIRSAPITERAGVFESQVRLWIEKGQLFEAYHTGQLDKLPRRLLYLAQAEPRWFANGSSWVIVWKTLRELATRAWVAPLRRALART